MSVDSAYRPVRRLTVVPVADEAVVYDRRNDRLHRLDPIATVVWSGLDGRTSVQVLCAELAEAYQAPVDQVTRDVVALLENLVEQELVTSGEDEATGDEEAADEEDEPEDPALGSAAPGHDRVLRVRPSICMDTVTGMGWHATDAFVTGTDGFVLGVRTADPETRERVRSLWAAVEWRDDLVADPNVSIRPPEELDGKLQLGQVFAECTLVARSRTIEELLDVALLEVSGRLALADPDLITCRVSVLRSPEGDTVLAPASWWSRLLNYDRALADVGWGLAGRHLVLNVDRKTEFGRRNPGRLSSLGMPMWLPGIGLRILPSGPVVEVVGPVGEPTSPAERTAAVASVATLGAGAGSAELALAVCAEIADVARIADVLDADAWMRLIRA